LWVVPVEARIEMDRGDHGVAAAQTPEDFARAAAAYRAAANDAPWYAPPYRRIAAASEKAGDRAGAITALRRYLAAAPPAPDRPAVAADLERLQSGGAPR